MIEKETEITLTAISLFVVILAFVIGGMWGILAVTAVSFYLLYRLRNV